MTFTQDEKYILVADKSGDAYRFSVDDGAHTGDLLLGHLSMLLDIVSIVDDGAHTGDLLLVHLSMLLEVIQQI